VLGSNAQTPERDRRGESSSILRYPLRRLAVASYWCDGDKSSFRELLAESAGITVTLYERAARGEPIEFSLVSALNYISLYDALAAGDFARSKELAGFIGWRSELDRQYQTTFDISFGYALKHLVLDDLNGCNVRLADLEEECRMPHLRGFAGYVRTMRAIQTRDAAQCTAGLRELLAGHRDLIAKGGTLHSTVQAFMCIWGLGLANLARKRAIDFMVPEDELLPKDLVI